MQVFDGQEILLRSLADSHLKWMRSLIASWSQCNFLTGAVDDRKKPLCKRSAVHINQSSLIEAASMSSPTKSSSIWFWMQVQPPFHSIYSSFKPNVIQRLAQGCLNSQPPGMESTNKILKAIFSKLRVMQCFLKLILNSRFDPYGSRSTCRHLCISSHL